MLLTRWFGQSERSATLALFIQVDDSAKAAFRTKDWWGGQWFGSCGHFFEKTAEKCSTVWADLSIFKQSHSLSIFIDCPMPHTLTEFRSALFAQKSTIVFVIIDFIKHASIHTHTNRHDIQTHTTMHKNMNTGTKLQAMSWTSRVALNK